MKAKALLTFLVAFSVGSLLVYVILKYRRAGTELKPITPYVFKTFEPFDFIDPEVTEFNADVKKLVAARDFKKLDELATKLSADKARFRGGVWRIFEFDFLLSRPLGEAANSAAWDAHLAFVKDWVKASPQSIYARTALINSHAGYGYHFRGDKTADQVRDSAWPRYLKSLAEAKAALAEAQRIPVRYVGYYSAALNVAKLDGADRDSFEKQYAEAIAFEPKYEYFYKEKAHYLLPRWGGSFGESESFAERVKMALGGDEGIKMYSVIIAELGRIHSGRYMVEHRVIWPDVLKGFELREAEFGPSRLRLNELARLSLYKNDSETTCNVFRRLDSPDAFEPSVWSNVAEFNANRGIAIQGICDTVKFNEENKERLPHLAEQIRRSRQ
jgi:hypothetical protein